MVEVVLSPVVHVADVCFAYKAFSSAVFIGNRLS